MDLNAYFAFVLQDRIDKYITTSTIVFLVYDIVLNLASEYQLIWRAKWGAVKSLYFFARYGALANLMLSFVVHLTPVPSMKVTKPYLSIPLMGLMSELLVTIRCEGRTWVYVVFGPTMFSIIVNTIFVLRIRALYNQSRKVLFFLISIVSVEFVFEMYGAISTMLSSSLMIAIPGLTWRGCTMVVSPETRHKTLFAWIPCLCVALVFFIMTLYKCLDVIQKTRKNKLNGSSSLLYLFMKDGTMYFLLIFCIALICSLFVTINTLQSSSNGPIDWFMALYSLAGSRLILNLREAAAGNTVNYSVSELSTWQAAPGRNRYTNSDMELGTIFTYRIGGETSSSSVDS